MEVWMVYDVMLSDNQHKSTDIHVGNIFYQLQMIYGSFYKSGHFTVHQESVYATIINVTLTMNLYALIMGDDHRMNIKRKQTFRIMCRVGTTQSRNLIYQ